MNHNDPIKGLEALTRAARQARPNDTESAPMGFSTRVVARAWATKDSTSLAGWMEMLSLRALLVSCLVMAVCLASSYGTLHAGSTSTAQADGEYELLDPVTEVFELSS